MKVFWPDRIQTLLSNNNFYPYIGEAYHLVHECSGNEIYKNCPLGNYSYFAKKIRSDCRNTLGDCYWNDKFFDCCEYFRPLETEIGLCFAINSAQTSRKGFDLKLNMVSNKYTGTGNLKFKIYTEVFVYTIGKEEVPSLTTPKSDVISVDLLVHYRCLLLFHECIFILK